MEKIKKILSSFDLQKKLNPKIWHLQNEKFMGDSEGQKYKLNPKVREHLLEIANQFIDSFGIDVVINDIIIRGSIASYNWSKYSDIDVHVLIDFDQFPPELRDLYSDFFYLKKVVFNDKRNIKIFGFDVELFVEQTDIEAYSDAIYSLMDNEWIKKPSKGKIEYSKEEISKEAEKWMNMIDTLINNTDDEDFDSVENAFNKIKRKLRKYRLDGLKKLGELSLENLVYKVLRRNKYIDKLYNSELKRQDKKLSLKETTLGKPLERMVVTSPFGKVRSGLGSKPHPGVDLGVPSGTELFAIADGVVEDAEIRKDACGGTLKIKHSDGYTSRFCHLKEIDVSKGSSVKQGQKVGSTGGGKNDVGRGHSTGSHLHFELYKNGIKVDPMTHIGTTINKIESKSNQSTKEFEKVLEKPEFKGVDVKEKIVKSKDSDFLKDFKKIIIDKKTFSKDSFDSTEVNDDIQIIQIALEYLDFLESKIYETGIYDEETEIAVEEFQKKYNLNVTGELKEVDLKIMYFLLVMMDFTDSFTDKVEKSIPKKKEEIEKNIDDYFYEEILYGIDVPLTQDNFKFLYLLRKVMGGIGRNNPFNLKSEKKTIDYLTPKMGIKASIKILSNKKFNCAIQKMRENKKLSEIIDCPIFYEFDVYEKMKEGLKNNKILPPKIY